HPGITPAAAREVIRESVTPWRFASDLRFGRGILNISEWIGGMLWLHQSDVFIDRSLNTQAQLSAFVFPTQPLVWSSSDTSVATVNQSGRVTGLTPGSATITVATQNGELADQLTVTVVNVGVTGVVLNQTSERDIIIGETFQLTATTIPANACSRNVVWRSSNSSITVDQNGLVTAGNNANRVADITARIYRGDGEYVQAETRFWTVYAPATRLTLDVTEHTMYFGQDVRVTAAVQPANADQFLHWRSNDPSVAEIISSGGVWPTWIVARGAGTAIITAQTRCGSHSSQVVITVPFVPVEGITLNRSEWTINENSTGVRLSPQLTPATAPNREVTWTTSDPSVATVRHYGFVDAVPGPGGVAIITATTQCGGHTAQATITVLPRVRVTGITIAGAATRALNVNQTLQLTATVTPANAANRNVQWQSTNPSVATVNGIGGVTARAPGTATIIATDAQTGDFSAQVIITVSRPVTGVSVSGAPAQLTRGQTAQLTANVTPVNATNRNVTWRSSDTSVATVSASGVVTAAGRGAATITATTVDGNRTAQTTIRVYNTIFSTRWEATFFNWLLFFLGFGFIWMWF
ncbi:MAG: Ig-like domain-containing protein, partial [Oscillospiraceae bacterium]|nr:Ig-like domain-containing protein [Oscillospiraceae bacterium]